jgi:hypothetical protein
MVTLDTYESAVAAGRFLTVPAGRDPDRLRLPAGSEFGRLTLVRSGYLLDQAVADSEMGRRITRELEASGYAIHEIDLTAYESPRG